MRQQAWTEVKEVLRDYPRYASYIHQIRQSKLYPYRITDENIGGGKSSSTHDSLERMVISIADDLTIRRLEHQKRSVEETLCDHPEWVEEMIEMMFLSRNKLSLTQAGELTGRSFRTAKKYYVEFMEDLAGRLGIYKGDE